MTAIPPRYVPIGKTAGGFGEVTFCDDQNLMRQVAIKFVHDPIDRRRILDEIFALQSLRSKHVVQVYDLISDSSGEIGIVEEFIEGNDLWNHPYPKSSLENYLKVLWQIASGLSDIHEAGIIHRDIKPNNMKLDLERIVKIYDFGLAREDGTDAKTKGFIGTLGFAAPELFEVETAIFSRAVDVYAFGAVAYFLLNSNFPDELKFTPPEPVDGDLFNNHSIGIPNDIAEILVQCLDHDPESRPKIFQVRDLIAKHLLRDRHQALVILRGDPSHLNSTTRQVSLELAGIGAFRVHYDGLSFYARSVSGEVYINNREMVEGMELPGSCVVALGGSHRENNQRAFITFDVSNPEVVL